MSVTQLSAEKLTRLAEKIKSDLDRQAKSEAEWVEATLALCADLAEARAEFKDNRSFGEWFDASGLKLNQDDRAAAIAMGQDLDRAREVLMVTKSRSLQLIDRNEFRSRSATKTPKAKRKSSRSRMPVEPTTDAELTSWSRDVPDEPIRWGDNLISMDNLGPAAQAQVRAALGQETSDTEEPDFLNDLTATIAKYLIDAWPLERSEQFLRDFQACLTAKKKLNRPKRNRAKAKKSQSETAEVETS